MILASAPTFAARMGQFNIFVQGMAKQLGVSGPQLWKAVVSNARTDAVWGILQLILFAITVVQATRLIRWLWREQSKNHSTDVDFHWVATIAGFGLGIVGAVWFFGVLGDLHSAIQAILSPDGYAADRFFRLFSGG